MYFAYYATSPRITPNLANIKRFSAVSIVATQALCGSVQVLHKRGLPDGAARSLANFSLLEPIVVAQLYEMVIL